MDCKNYRDFTLRDPILTEYKHVCRRPSGVRDLVLGGYMSVDSPAYVERGPGGSCGPSGRLWTAKDTDDANPRK